MPPKPIKKPGESKKTELKKKEKVIEDKTFGLKNKKGAKQQRFIQQVTQQVKSGQAGAKKTLDDKKLKKEDKKKEQDDLNTLFRPVTIQKVAKGVDPKSVLCAFYKQGQCAKGDKCKFSHDLTIERKSEKRSVYVDARDDLEKDTMDNWDEAKLEEVVKKKHGEAEQKATTKTEIICRHFLQAIEDSKYGWFWECPVGEKCIYRHALPPGFVLKKDKKKDDKRDEISIEDLVEKERASLGQTLTRVTLETFLTWKKKKIKEKQAKLMADEDKKKADFKAGKAFGLSGREMFTFNPEMAIEDDEEADDVALVYERDEDDIVLNGPRELTLEALASIAQEVDDTGTLAALDRKPGFEDDASKLGEAAALSDERITENGLEINEDLFNEEDVPVDENLFDGEDLDEVEEGLEQLDMEDS